MNNYDDTENLAVGIDLGTSNSTVAYFQNGECHFLKIHGKNFLSSVIYFAETKWIYGENALNFGSAYPDALFKNFKLCIGEKSPQIFKVKPAAAKTKYKYIIDANIFIESPFILEKFGKDAEIIIPKIVIEELEYKKIFPETADEAELALQSIEEYKNIISFEDSHLELLKNSCPKNNANALYQILSVALKHDAADTVLISNDKILAKKSADLPHKFKIQNYAMFNLYHRIIQNISHKGEFQITGKDAAAIFLQHLREEICKKIGYVSKAVITVPQEFSPIQYNEIKDAGFTAGFTEIELQTEPIAAAVAYGMELMEDAIILVYDFGGGTFDVSILKISGNNFTRVSSGGDSKLGGENFTQAIIEDFKEKLMDDEILDMFDEENSGLSHEEFAQNNFKIWKACENIKCNLSETQNESETVPLYVRPGQIEEVDYNLSRAEFENLTAELIVKSRKALDITLQRANLKRGDIDVVIMAGGTSLIPCIGNFVRQYFGKLPYSDKNPATLIAEGAAFLADLKWNDNSTSNIEIFNKTMTDLGVAVKGHIFNVIIPANSELPIDKERVYFLQRDEQTELLIEIFTRDEGSNATRIFDSSIKCIGQVQISNLPPLKKDEVNIWVNFSLSPEYELEVEINLKDNQGLEIEQAQVAINLLGI